MADIEKSFVQPLLTKPLTIRKRKTSIFEDDQGGPPPIERNTTLVAAGVNHAGHKGGPDATQVADLGLFGDLAVALFAVFMGATDGISLGSILFPHDAAHPNYEFRTAGMSIGLLSAAACNLALALGSQMPHSVGGAIMPVAPIMAAFFATLGPSEPATCLICVPLMTILTGVLTYAAGRAGCVGDIVRSCPFAVFSGFIAGTGAQLLEFGLNMMYPGFVHFTDPASLSALCTVELWTFCGPGVVTALFVFLLPRYVPRIGEFLLPITVILVTAVFYGVLAATKVSVEEARSAGWLFSLEIPSGIDCFKVWTLQDIGAVNWDLIFSMQFVIATLQVSLLGFLTMGKNIYGASEVTRCAIDVDKEMRVAGLSNIFTGAMGGMPGNLVMSFAVTAHQLGVRSKRFSWLMFVFSLALFIVGDFVIALLPKMVPALTVLWLGIVLIVCFLWDYLGKVSVFEYCIILVMTVMDLAFGVEYAIMFGLLATFVITFVRLNRMEVVRETCSLAEIRSDVLRSSQHNNILSKHSQQLHLVRLHYAYLAFLEAAKILDLVDERLKRKDLGPMRFLVLDFKDVGGIAISSLNSMRELLNLGREEGFVVMVVQAKDGVAEAIRKFGIPVRSPVSQSGTIAVEELPLEPTTESMLFVSDFVSESRALGALSLALELAEEDVLATNLGGATTRPHNMCARACVSACWMLDLETSQKSLDSAMKVTGVDVEDPRLAVLSDVHRLLSKTYKQYDPTMLGPLSECLEVADYEAGAVIYSFQPQDAPEHKFHWADSELESVPPLIWLVEGDVEHVWNGHAQEDSHVRQMASMHGFRPNTRFERMVLRPTTGRAEACCLGPMQMLVSWYGSMVHLGRAVALKPSRCILLRRSSFLKGIAKMPEVAQLFDVYLAKSRFIAAGFPDSTGHEQFHF